MLKIFLVFNMDGNNSISSSFQGMAYSTGFNLQEDDFFDFMQNLSTPSYTIEEKALSSDHPLTSSSGFLISFGSSTLNQAVISEEEEDIALMINSHLDESAYQESRGNNTIYKRTPLQAQDHVAAERNRREKMSQLFISLSKVVPGLKKLDKSSILGDTIEYMKELQEQVKILEEIKQKIQSPCQKSGSSSFSKENVNGSNQIVGSNVKARISNKSVLINIHCNKEGGMVERVLSQMEKLHLAVHDIRIMPFGLMNLDISILAEMENGCCITVQDIVYALQINILGQVQSLNE